MFSLPRWIVSNSVCSGVGLRAVCLGVCSFDMAIAQASDALTVLIQGMQDHPAHTTFMVLHFAINTDEICSKRS